jgi:hypothetical protein
MPRTVRAHKNSAWVRAAKSKFMVFQKKYAWMGSVHRQMDWTDGCIAVTDAEIDEIYPLVAVGTVVEIRP